MNIRLNSSAPKDVYVRKRELCFSGLLGTQTVLTSNDIYFPVQHYQGQNKNCPTQYLLTTYLIHNFFFFFFAVIDLVAARESIVLLRNTAGLSMSMESCWQMYSGNFKENMSAPLKEAGQRGENVTRETRSKWEILPSLPIVLQQTLCSVRWKIICSSNKHHRAADMGASPTGRKAVVTLEYILDASV